MTLSPEAWIRIRTAIESRIADLRAISCAPALTGGQREHLRLLADQLTLDVVDLARVLGTGK